MNNEFLTDEEMARLTGYRVNQRKRIRCFLQTMKIPFLTNSRGDAVVKRCDLSKSQEQNDEETPNFNWLKRA